MKQIIVTMHLVIFILYLTVTPMLILCHIKGKSEFEGSLKSFIKGERKCLKLKNWKILW